MKLTALAFIATALVALAAPVHAEKSAGNVIDDSTINAGVKAALAGVKGLPDSQIVVETYKGEVLLGGFVESKEQKSEADKAAKGVSGVKKGHNGLAVRMEPVFGSDMH